MFTKKVNLRRMLAVTTALSVAAPYLPAQAQDAGAAAPPARVGAIATINGGVSYNGAGSNNQWIAATPNYPLSAGDAVFTQAGAQAGLALDDSRITLAASTELQVTGLNASTLAATESQGEVFLAVNYLAPGQRYVITTPRGAVTISQNGNYDIAAGDQNDPTVVTVLAGAASVSAPGLTLQVAAGQAGVLSGADQTIAQLGTAQRDAFTDQMLAEIPPPPPDYAPPVVQQMTGVALLSNYGSWDQSGTYGAVWYPRVNSGWAPYHEGHWAYVAPWGYTWVDAEPWGFAPSHYGRWIDDGGRWGWVPAAAYSPGSGYGPSYQPVYAPAVVSFFGLGIAAGITIAALSHGNVGWVPLAPNEPYYPSYRSSPEYLQRINQTNVRNYTEIHTTTIINNYNNFANRRAATYVPADAMSRGEAVARYGHAAPQAMLADARPVGPGFGAQPGGNHAMTLPPPMAQHRQAPAPQRSGFADRAAPPPAMLSHAPSPGMRPGQPFAGPGAQTRQPEAQHPGFRPPPVPPAGGEHTNQLNMAPVQRNFPGSNGGMIRPEAARPEAARPEAARPMPQVIQPHEQMQAPRPQAPVPAFRPEPAPFHPQPQFHPQEQQRSEAPRAEMPQAEMPRPEMPRPEMARPEMARPAAPRPEAPRPENRPQGPQHDNHQP